MTEFEVLNLADTYAEKQITNFKEKTFVKQEIAYNPKSMTWMVWYLPENAVIGSDFTVSIHDRTQEIELWGGM